MIGALIAFATTAVPLRLLHTADLQSPTIYAQLELRPAGLDVVLLFMGCGGVLFFALLLRAQPTQVVVRPWALWGLLTYTTMIVVPAVDFVVPGGVAPDLKMACFVPGGIFELLFGLMLLVRGVRRHR